MNKNTRIVILGGNSFVASNFINLLRKKKIKYLPIFKKNIDLTKKNSISKLSKLLKRDDILIFISAVAPVKNFTMLNQNLDMCKNVHKVLQQKNIKYLLYVSSDAVYSDTKKKITEKSDTNPENLHGFMHLMRENILKLLNVNLCIVRPTLIFGTEDTHNGYGPNQFIRLAQLNKKINIFGKGEEKRDHIHVDDVGEAIFYLIKKQYIGTVNLVTGRVISFYEIAQKIKDTYKIRLNFKKRGGPMPHNGYRAFDNKILRKILPKEYNFINVLNWINKKERYK